MKKLLILLVLINSVLFATTKTKEDAEIKKEAIKTQIEKEKKFAKEQKFYTEKNYDFKSIKVNPKTLKHIPEIEVDDLDMDDVYN
jgi:sortase (surface protein transpeptidase)